ncbi:HdeD family acid-resistance protein [Pseudomonadota bacterium]
MNELTQVSKNVKIWGWVILIVGILAVISPLVTGLTVAVMVAILLIIAGIARIIHAFQGGGFWTGAFGVFALLAGLVVLGRPLLGLASLTMVLIVYFLAVGISEIMVAFQIRPNQGWGFLLFSGLISIVLAMAIWNQWPLSGAWAIGILVGIQLIFSGMTMITIGSAMTKG